MAEFFKPDVCIVGAGELGIALAIKARQRGLATVLVYRGAGEPGDLVQNTLHRAALAASAAQAQAIRTGARLGLDNGAPKLNYKSIAEHAADLAATAAPDSSAERLAALGVVVLTGEPEFTGRHNLRVGDTLLKPGYTIIATGSTPFVPELPGISDIAYFTPDTIVGNLRKLSHLLVIGGGATALELAQAYRRLGSEVTLVPQGPLLVGYDGETASILLRHLREEGMAVLEGAGATAFLPRSQGIGVNLDHPDGSMPPLDISHVLLAAGRVPDLGWTETDKPRLKRRVGQPDQLQLDHQGRTSHPRISALGGAAGEDNYHLSLRLGERLLDRLAGRPGAGKDRAHLPRLVATQPALAQIGAADLTAGLKAGQSVLRANLAENAAARAQGLGRGSAKLLIDRHGKILGGAMVGEGAGEVIASLAMAMNKGVSAGELACLPLTGTSALAVLTDLGNQFANQRPLSNWAKRRSTLRRLLP